MFILINICNKCHHLQATLNSSWYLINTKYLLFKDTLSKLEINNKSEISKYHMHNRKHTIKTFPRNMCKLAGVNS